MELLHTQVSESQTLPSVFELGRRRVGPDDPQGRVVVGTDGVERADYADRTLVLCKTVLSVHLQISTTLCLIQTLLIDI